MEISDEAVRVALHAWNRGFMHSGDPREVMREVLQSAIPLVVEELVGPPSYFLHHIDDGYPKGFREGSNLRRQTILDKVKS